mgnify:FL=1|jgi:hypothetical protein
MRFFLLCKPIAIIQQLMEEPITEAIVLSMASMCLNAIILL